ncbi:lysosomal acid glucosylceramidase-like [Hylaeus anthracinus]|uniref:lysosomal acid glucosylceramidase-like n=1 Tax=Hylaeus anthracinus TaxID=313031 RepID=UPI0023BA1052|nr:lysosomal acid glucosylceramidase-like [Hylaeus anthracinus]
MWSSLLVIAFLLVSGYANDCVPRSFGTDRIVCVCNATYCDGLPEDHPEVPEDGSAYLYESNKGGLRLKVSTVKFGSCRGGGLRHNINLDSSKKYQKILGFGGAITDSAGINIKKLSPAAQEQLLRSYYDPKTGSKYTLGRVPIGSTDFSTRPYTYDDTEDDVTLEHFALAPEDYNYKIPIMKKAVKLSPKILFISATWTPPKWMKTNNKNTGFLGSLKNKYYQTYADYILKFLDEYKKNGLDIWAVSTGNEPINALIPLDPLSSMGWTPNTVGKWVANNLGPTLNQSQHDTLIFALDDQSIFLPWYVDQIARNEKANNYIAGIASHWYADVTIPLTLDTALDATHRTFPDKFLLMTEACVGSLEIRPVNLGAWDRGERYISSIIDYMNHWYVGWMDWNIALDERGGPTYINNFVDSPIIVNGTSDEFYKQPMYYALKHFSRFVDRDSDRISISNALLIKSTAFLTPSNEIVVVLYNSGPLTEYMTLNDPQKGSLCLTLSPHSFNTIKYKL